LASPERKPARRRAARSPAGNLLLSARGPVVPADAVAALLILEGGRYILQLRDPKPEIFYPDHWGCFGGALSEGESPMDALRRELREELEFEMTEAREFTRFDFDFAPLGQPRVFRLFYEVPVSRKAYRGFVLHEGKECRDFSAAEALGNLRVTPYDAFAIWLHHRREHLRG
jgi:8-oxo-dGTP pyrophosphatase MutT (NUDIX family)